MSKSCVQRSVSEPGPVSAGSTVSAPVVVPARYENPPGIVSSSVEIVTVTGLSLRSRSVYALNAFGALASRSGSSVSRSGSQEG